MGPPACCVATRCVGTAMTFTVVTWNIRGSARPDLSLLADAINSYAPDVVLLQEVWREQAWRLANLLDMGPPFWSLKHRPFGPLSRRRAEGMAIVSRATLAEETSYVLTPSARPWTHRRRIVQHARIASLGVDVTNVHLASHAESSARVDQARMICAQIAKGVSANAFIGGDFNAHNEPALWSVFEERGFVDAGSSEGAATNPAGAATQRLDRVLVGRGLRVASLVVPDDGPSWSRLSDHLPVVVQVDIGERTASQIGTDA